MKHTLEVDSIQLSYGDREILSDIYFRAETGNVYGVLGRNGEGKSSLFNIMLGQLQPASKSIRFDGKSTYEAFRQKYLLAYLPQSSFIPPYLKIKRVLRDFQIKQSALTDRFPEFQSRISDSIATLSGGLRRLLEVFVILETNCHFCILDEPFSHIMPIHIETIVELIGLAKQDKGIIISDHLYQTVIAVSDVLYLLKNKRLRQLKDTIELQDLGYLPIV